MYRISAWLAAFLLAASFHAASAQGTATSPPAPSEAKPGKIKLTTEKLREMRAKWVANRPKLRACRAEVKAKGLVGDDRWFYIEDCMSRR